MLSRVQHLNLLEGHGPWGFGILFSASRIGNSVHVILKVRGSHLGPQIHEDVHAANPQGAQQSLDFKIYFGHALLLLSSWKKGREGTWQKRMQATMKEVDLRHNNLKKDLTNGVPEPKKQNTVLSVSQFASISPPRLQICLIFIMQYVTKPKIISLLFLLIYSFKG